MSDWQDQVETERVVFTNADGFELSGALDRPKGREPHAYTVFSHCFTCSKQFKAAVYLGRELAARGIAMMRFDFPGLGDSEGDFSQTTFTGYVQDIERAAGFLRKQYESPRALIGHSLGGAASLRAANRIESVELVVTLAATAYPGRLGSRLMSAREEADATGLGRLRVQGRSFQLRREFFDDLARSSLEETVRGLRPSLLVIHAPDDETVPYRFAETLLAWAGEKADHLKMDGAAHMYGNREHVETIAGAIAERIQG